MKFYSKFQIHKKSTLILMFSLAFLFICNNNLIAQAKDKLVWKKTKNGLQYKIVENKEAGKAIKLDDYITFQAIFRNAKDSMLLTSTNDEPFIVSGVPEPTYKGCLNEGWTLLNEGDSAIFKVLADSLYLKTFQVPQLPPFIESGEMLTVSFRILKVQTKEEAEAEYTKIQAEKKVRIDKKFEIDAKETQEYVASKLPNAIAHPNGFYYIIHKEGTGELIQMNDIVEIEYTSSFLNGKITETYEGENAKELIMGYDPLIPAWTDALPMMKEGAEWTLVVPSKLAYGENDFYEIPAFTPLIFNIKIVNIKDEAERLADLKKVEENELKLINEFLAKPENQGYKQTETGLYYLVEKAAKGAQPKAGNQLTVHYTGKFLDGKVFDSSVDRGQPFKFTIGQGQVINGWEEGLMRMKVGEKYKLLLPSKLAYGENGNSGILPFTTLYFEVELISIGDKN